MSTDTAPKIDEKRLHEFMGKVVAELGAVMNGALVLIGDELGLYRAMADSKAVTPTQLAEKTSTSERMVREWLAAQAAGGYVTYNASEKTFTLPPEQALALATENSPCFVAGGFDVPRSVYLDLPQIIQAFRDGRGLGWDRRSPSLFRGTERFFRSTYLESLTSSWIPALEEVEDKLSQGAKVADIGCGHGASTLLMGQAYPQSQFVGFDFHPKSIETARTIAEIAGIKDSVTFEVASAKEYPGGDYDLVTFFDCLHDMGDPVGAAEHVRRSLKPNGTWMIVEPFAHDQLESNFNPIGRVFYAASAMICTPASMAQEVGLALGAQAGELRLREVVTKGGFNRFRRATETPFNIVYEARP
ncbi:MAG TPA: class I SAM-dependent methyltransferase [Chthoniobacteraceae bacterium]|nr:class I SAM-dependent methyltransferase [Chthoniobacteraceae bacterium]